jgi:hypothetical protein
MGIFKRRKRKKEVRLVMNENEVHRIFNRINGGACMACQTWRGDHVRAAIGRFLVEHWDHKDGQPLPTPPTPQQLARLCCRYEPAPGEVDPNEVGTFIIGMSPP